MQLLHNKVHESIMYHRYQYFLLFGIYFSFFFTHSPKSINQQRLL